MININLNLLSHSQIEYIISVVENCWLHRPLNPATTGRSELPLGGKYVAPCNRDNSSFPGMGRERSWNVSRVCDTWIAVYKKVVKLFYWGKNEIQWSNDVTVIYIYITGYFFIIYTICIYTGIYILYKYIEIQCDWHTVIWNLWMLC